ncbi:MFS transporter [SAR202 cluster bacterium AC-647-N09_OGT_505m]|nr:MFS transporter [SAR202 cluster bacterium AC-647-N09_OGT_505m]
MGSNPSGRTISRIQVDYSYSTTCDIITMVNDRPSTSKITIISWALYDLANTMFSFNIVSIHFALWVVNDMGGTDSHYGYANAISMLLVLVTAPILGAISDQAKRRIPFLIGTTCCCVVFTSLLGQGGLSTSLVVFVVANYMFQSGLIFYDALLPTISTDQNRGKVGAFGVGLGYVGSLIGACIGLFLLDTIGRVGIFQVTAFLFLVFSIPCFVMVKEYGAGPLRMGFGTLIDSASQIRNTFAKTQTFPGLRRFLVGRVFYADTVNTLILFMGIYVTNELGFTDAQVQIIMAVSIVSAILGSPIWGFIVDSIGPKKSLNIVLYLWMIVLVGVAAVPLLSLPFNSIWIIAPLSGIALGGTWCADRPYLVRLVPPQYIGEFFGIYSMVGRFASIIGPVLWVFVADTLGLGRPIAVLTLLVLVLISYGILQGIDDKPREWWGTEVYPRSS